MGPYLQDEPWGSKKYIWSRRTTFNCNEHNKIFSRNDNLNLHIKILILYHIVAKSDFYRKIDWNYINDESQITVQKEISLENLM